MIPTRVYDQFITNFPSPLWLREVADADFNDPVVTDVDVAAQTATQTPPRLPAQSGDGRPLQPANVSQDCESEVAA